MFKHIYINSLKIYVREKTIVFWLLIFPMILSIFFKLGFSNLMEGEAFELIPIAVESETEENTPAQTVYRAVFSEMGDIFDVRYTDRAEAEKLLNEGAVDAYISIGDVSGGYRLGMTVGESGLNQNIVRSVLDRINEGAALVMSGKVAPEDMADVMNTENVLHNVNMSGQKQDYVSAWFYTVLGMTAMYGSMLGVAIIKNIQANQSAKAMRFNLAPVSKLKSFVAMFAAGATLHAAIMIIVYLYLRYVMNISFGDRQGYIILTSVAGGITGIAIGTVISVLVKAGENFKIGICMAVSMLGSFLAGMMDSTMKYTVMRSVPAIEYINPAGILTDSYLKLYYYKDLSYFWGNVMNLLIIAVICITVTIIVLRRQRYDSI